MVLILNVVHVKWSLGRHLSYSSATSWTFSLFFSASYAISSAILFFLIKMPKSKFFFIKPCMEILLKLYFSRWFIIVIWNYHIFVLIISLIKILWVRFYLFSSFKNMMCTNKYSMKGSKLSPGVFEIWDCSSSLFRLVTKGGGGGGLPLFNLNKFNSPKS